MKKYFAERFKERFKNKFGDFSDESFLIIPSFVDVHVHLREPGFFYKETIASGSRAAAASGYGHIFSMPNLNPVPDTLENLKVQLKRIEKNACIDVRPYGAITNVLMAIVGIPFTFVYPPEVTTISVVMVAVMGIFMLGLPYALYSVAINYCPPLGCVLISSIEIVLNPVWVWLGTGEMPDTFAMIGSAVILVTVTLWCALGGAQAKEIEMEIEESKELEG